MAAVTGVFSQAATLCHLVHTPMPEQITQVTNLLLKSLFPRIEVLKLETEEQWVSALPTDKFNMVVA